MTFLNLNCEEFKILKNVLNDFKLDFVFDYDDNYEIKLSEIYDYLLYFCILYRNSKSHLIDKVLEKIKIFLDIDNNILELKESELVPMKINFDKEESKVFIEMLNNYGFSLTIKMSNVMIFDKIVVDFFRELACDYIMISGSFDANGNTTEIGNVIEGFIDKFFIDG